MPEERRRGPGNIRRDVGKARCCAVAKQVGVDRHAHEASGQLYNTNVREPTACDRAVSVEPQASRCSRAGEHWPHLVEIPFQPGDEAVRQEKLDRLMGFRLLGGERKNPAVGNLK